MTAAGGDPAPAGGMVHAGMHPPFSFRSWPKRKRAVHGPKEKAVLARSGAVALRATGVGGSVTAPILPGLRARYNLLPGRYCRPVADGADGIGVVIALSSFSFRCRWLSREEATATGR